MAKAKSKTKAKSSTKSKVKTGKKNMWVVAVIVLLVASVGGFFVYRSFAGSITIYQAAEVTNYTSCLPAQIGVGGKGLFTSCKIWPRGEIRSYVARFQGNPNGYEACVWGKPLTSGKVTFDIDVNGAKGASKSVYQTGYFGQFTSRGDKKLVCYQVPSLYGVVTVKSQGEVYITNYSVRPL